MFNHCSFSIITLFAFYLTTLCAGYSSREICTWKKAAPGLFDVFNGRPTLSRFHGVASLGRRSLQTRQTNGKHDRRSEHSPSGSSSQNTRLFSQVNRLSIDTGAGNMSKQGQAPVEKGTATKEQAKRKKKTKGRDQAKNDQGEGTKVTIPEDESDHQGHGQTTGQSSVDALHSKGTSNRKEDYWSKVLKYQGSLLDAESMLRNPEYSKSLRGGPARMNRYVRQVDIAQNNLKFLESGVSRDLYFYAGIGTPHHRNLLSKAEKQIEKCERSIRPLQTGQHRTLLPDTRQVFEQLLLDARRRLDQLRMGELPSGHRPKDSSEGRHSMSSQRSLTSNEQREIIEAGQQELYEVEKELQEARVSRKPDHLLKSLRSEIRYRKQKLQEIKVAFAKGETRGPGRLSRTAKEVVMGKSSTKDAEENDGPQNGGEDLQSQILEARMAFQKAKLQLQTARKEKWLPEMLESLEENVNQAGNQLNSLQRSTQGKGKKKLNQR